MALSEELQWRGFVNQTTFSDISEVNTPRKFYLGVDPSSDSMQIGNLAAVMLVKHLIRGGHSAVVLVGGATGMIGDPKEDDERELKALEEIEINKKGIAAQYKRLLDGETFELVDNYDWFKDIGYLQFLRDIGKQFAMSDLLNRDFVKSRIGEDKAGISYAEFSYSLIQGYDFLHLYREMGVTMQIGGSDQWGNMLSGVPLIRKLADGEAHVWTLPLIINKTTGKKFGKSEGGAVWLDETKTSVYKFYQFWINADDEGVEDYMKIYTLLNKDDIEAIMAEHKQYPEKRTAQKRLAYEVTKIVHGEQRASSVAAISETLFGTKSYQELSSNDFAELRTELPHKQINAVYSLVDLLVEVGLAGSKGEARRFLESNAIYINGQQIPLAKNTLEQDDFIDGFCVLRRGKNANVLVELG